MIETKLLLYGYGVVGAVLILIYEWQKRKRGYTPGVRKFRTALEATLGIGFLMPPTPVAWKAAGGMLLGIAYMNFIHYRETNWTEIKNPKKLSSEDVERLYGE